ncbi:MAG: hypothetical protein Q7K21_07650 [Elusimicrobiota bacterium]|nr:hypothetical protein [Elusimicrobiota bacterium]
MSGVVCPERLITDSAVILEGDVALKEKTVRGIGASGRTKFPGSNHAIQNGLLFLIIL